jgi:hypothetical protein
MHHSPQRKSIPDSIVRDCIKWPLSSLKIITIQIPIMPGIFMSRQRKETLNDFQELETTIDSELEGIRFISKVLEEHGDIQEYVDNPEDLDKIIEGLKEISHDAEKKNDEERERIEELEKLAHDAKMKNLEERMDIDGLDHYAHEAEAKAYEEREEAQETGREEEIEVENVSVSSWMNPRTRRAPIDYPVEVLEYVLEIASTEDFYPELAVDNITIEFEIPGQAPNESINRFMYLFVPMMILLFASEGYSLLRQFKINSRGQNVKLSDMMGEKSDKKPIVLQSCIFGGSLVWFTATILAMGFL